MTDEFEEDYTRQNQRLKAYWVMRYLQENTDSEHLKRAVDIAEDLYDLGIPAEQKSVNKDIKYINATLLLEETAFDDPYAMDLLDALEAVQEKENQTIKFKYANRQTRGYFYDRGDKYFNEVRLILESVYSSKFVSEAIVADIEKRILKGVSKYDREKLKHITPITNRATTQNSRVFDNVKIISNAISTSLNGKRHKPEKIQFNYNEYYIPEGSLKPKKRYGRKSELYTVSPYYLMINDGNYYLLCYDDKYGKRTFRVDRMENIQPIGIERDGEEEFRGFNAKEYAKQNFAMFEGENKHITIQFVTSKCLNTVVDKFGTASNIVYKNTDKGHFTVSLTTGVNPQFYGWLCSFGNLAKIVDPPEIIEEFEEYIDGIKKLYK